MCFRDTDKQFCEYFDLFGLITPIKIICHKVVKKLCIQRMKYKKEIMVYCAVIGAYVHYLLERQNVTSMFMPYIIPNHCQTQRFHRSNCKSCIYNKLLQKYLTYMYIMVKSYYVKEKIMTESLPGSEKLVRTKNNRLTLNSTWELCGNNKT